MANTNKTLGKKNNDEIYTSIDEVEKEVKNYKSSFAGKIVYCNTDSETSAFFKYFMSHFHELGIKILYCTSIEHNGSFIAYDGNRKYFRQLKQGGYFESDECVEILKKSDIVVSNPPFSMIHQYINLIIQYGKKYLIIGPVTALQKQHIQQFIDGEFGYGLKDPNRERMSYRNTDMTYANHCWLTNLKSDVKKQRKSIKKSFDIDTYRKYDDTDILYIDSGDKIPYNYDGPMAIAKTFIPGMYDTYDKTLHMDTPIGDVKFKIIGYGDKLKLDGKEKFDRIIIQKIDD